MSVPLEALLPLSVVHQRAGSSSTVASIVRTSSLTPEGRILTMDVQGLRVELRPSSAQYGMELSRAFKKTEYASVCQMLRVAGTGGHTMLRAISTWPPYTTAPVAGPQGGQAHGGGDRTASGDNAVRTCAADGGRAANDVAGEDDGRGGGPSGEEGGESDAETSQAEDAEDGGGSECEEVVGESGVDACDGEGGQSQDKDGEDGGESDVEEVVDEGGADGGASERDDGEAGEDRVGAGEDDAAELANKGRLGGDPGTTVKEGWRSEGGDGGLRGCAKGERVLAVRARRADAVGGAATHAAAPSAGELGSQRREHEAADDRDARGSGGRAPLGREEGAEDEAGGGLETPARTGVRVEPGAVAATPPACGARKRALSPPRATLHAFLQPSHAAARAPYLEPSAAQHICVRSPPPRGRPEPSARGVSPATMELARAIEDMRERVLAEREQRMAAMRTELALLREQLGQRRQRPRSWSRPFSVLPPCVLAMHELEARVAASPTPFANDRIPLLAEELADVQALVNTCSAVRRVVVGGYRLARFRAERVFHASGTGASGEQRHALGAMQAPVETTAMFGTEVFVWRSFQDTDLQPTSAVQDGASVLAWEREPTLNPCRKGIYFSPRLRAGDKLCHVADDAKMAVLVRVRLTHTLITSVDDPLWLTRDAIVVYDDSLVLPECVVWFQ